MKSLRECNILVPLAPSTLWLAPKWKTKSGRDTEARQTEQGNKYRERGLLPGNLHRDEHRTPRREKEKYFSL